MEISSELFENWQRSLEDFHKGVKKELEEIRKYKDEVQQMKLDIYDQLQRGTYIHDDERIVISAPEIIIGNTDPDGILKPGCSSVILRGNHVGLEGVGAGKNGIGTIVSRASVIKQIGVDPGPDGLENVVKLTSSVSSQARSVVLNSNDAEGVFTENRGGTGILLQSDTNISVQSTLANATKKKRLDEISQQLQKELKDKEKTANDKKKLVESRMKDLFELVKKDAYTFDADLMDIRTGTDEIYDLHEEFNYLAKDLYEKLNAYMSSLSYLAEANRKISCIKEEQEIVSRQKSNFKDKSTNTSISINSENISIRTIDGDGGIRTNPESGVQIASRNVSLLCYNDQRELMEDSRINLVSNYISVSTVNPKIKDDKGDFLSQGCFSVSSKNITMEGVDYSINNDKLEEKALTKKGSFYLRFENIKMDTTGTDGKADGHIGMNSKQVEIKTMDVDKDSRKDKSLTAGSSLLLLSEKVFTGSKEKKIKSKLLQLASDEIAAIGEKTVELQQGKALVQLNGGDASISGGKTQFYGATTLFGKTALKSDLEAGDIDVKNIKIKSSFKSPCTSEGMAVPGAPSTAKLNAKMKEEEFTSTEKKG